MPTLDLRNMGQGFDAGTAGTTLPTLPSMGRAPGADTTTSPGPTLDVAAVEADPEFHMNFNPVEFVGQMVGEAVKGAVAPITAASEIMQGFFSDPEVGILDNEDGRWHFQKAGDALVDGAAFYGSLAVGGVAGNVVKGALAKTVLSGAAGSAAP